MLPPLGHPVCLLIWRVLGYLRVRNLLLERRQGRLGILVLSIVGSMARSAKSCSYSGKSQESQPSDAAASRAPDLYSHYR